MKTIFCFLFSCIWFADISAQGWTHQNPIHEIVDLYAIDFSGPHGLVAGQGDELFITHDGGATWQSRHTSLFQSPARVAVVVSGTNGQIMLAAAERLVISRDGGDTWKIVDADLNYIFKLQVLPQGEWIAFGSYYIFRSYDQGETWEKITYGWGAETGHFTSLSNGWMEKRITNSAYQIWVTTDGGINWNLRDSTVFNNVNIIDMADDSIGFFTTGFQVYKTVNGGFNWELMDVSFSGSITDLYVIDANEVYASLYPGQVLYTLDGGITWKNYDPKLVDRDKAFGIYANNLGQVWMCGNYVSILHSVDFGKHWINQMPIRNHNLYCTDFFNESMGVAGGATGTFLKTLDGGMNWQTVSIPTVDTLFAIHLLDTQKIITGSSLGNVFYSKDQGITWNIIGSGFGKINAIDVLDVQTFLLATNDGKIYKTIDSGNQWNLVYEDEGYPLKDLEFVDSLTGYAAGRKGQILKTSNSGDTWLPVANPGKGDFSAMTFTTPLEGWFVASNQIDSLWHTLDGGQSWEIIQFSPSFIWTGIHFTNPDTGWIVGGNPIDGYGFVFRTNNHGATWEYDHTTYDEISGMAGVRGTEKIWIIGFGGHIEHYSPCEGTPQLMDLNGNNHPCTGDTITYTVISNNVDHYDWSFPFDWEIYSNQDSSVIQVVVGLLPGQIEVTGSNLCNAFSTQIMQVDPADSTSILVTENNGILSADLSGGYYQWLLNGIEIPGANQSSYTPSESGIYELLYSKFENGCIVHSNTLNITISNTKDSWKDEIQIFPIPAKTEIFIQASTKGIDLHHVKIALYSPDGVMVLNTHLNDGHLNLSGLTQGMYFLSIQNAQVHLIRKIVIQ